MGKLKFKSTVNYAFINSNFKQCRGLVLPGGTRSTKTISILQWIIIYCRTNQYKRVVVVRDTLSNLKKTVLKDFNEICIGEGDYDALAPKMHFNHSKMTGYIGTCTIEFIGVNDDPMRVHGLKSDIFYINEAIGVTKKTFTQLSFRCKEGFLLDCNPSTPDHWLYNLENRDDVKFFRTTYLDNPFLGKDQIAEIEATEPTPENVEAGTADEREWSIYGKGEIYRGAEIIYPKWQTYSGDIEEYDNVFFGVDWGINHPLAVIEVKVNGNNLYVREVFYKRGIKDLEALLIPELLKEPLIAEGKTYLICDSAEQKSIHTLVKNKIPAFGVKKPHGSVLAGIRKVAKYKLFVHKDSANIQNELNRYKWKVNDKTGDILDVPVKLWDDACDAIRYVVYTYL